MHSENPEITVFSDMSPRVTTLAQYSGSVLLDEIVSSEDLYLLGLDNKSYDRSQLVDGVVELSDGDITREELELRKDLVEGFQEYAESLGLDARYLPQATFSTDKLKHLPPVAHNRVGETVTTSALDIFLKTDPSRVIRIADLRSSFDVDADSRELESNGKEIQKELDSGILLGIKCLLEGTSENKVIRPVKNVAHVYYYKPAHSAQTKHRAYIADANVSDTSDTTVTVVRSFVRIADCATEKGQKQLYRRALGVEMTR